MKMMRYQGLQDLGSDFGAIFRGTCNLSYLEAENLQHGCKINQNYLEIMVVFPLPRSIARGLYTHCCNVLRTAGLVMSRHVLVKPS